MKHTVKMSCETPLISHPLNPWICTLQMNEASLTIAISGRFNLWFLIALEGHDTSRHPAAGTVIRLDNRCFFLRDHHSCYVFVVAEMMVFYVATHAPFCFKHSFWMLTSCHSCFQGKSLSPWRSNDTEWLKLGQSSICIVQTFVLKKPSESSKHPTAKWSFFLCMMFTVLYRLDTQNDLNVEFFHANQQLSPPSGSSHC